jgi:hypothetical protein
MQAVESFLSLGRMKVEELIDAGLIRKLDENG